jgi:hypothetical protein
MDSNFQYAGTVRWHRATDLPLPPTVSGRSRHKAWRARDWWADHFSIVTFDPNARGKCGGSAAN